MPTALLTDLPDFTALLRDPAWAPRWGWHDDHREHDGTPAYLPAVQQVRAEIMEFIGLLRSRGLCGSCLQLGLGECDASHDLWREVFCRVVSIDLRACRVGPRSLPGLDTHSIEAFGLAEENGPYDLVFIDAGHSYRDVMLDHADYGQLRRSRGVVAFHDALPRAAYPEVGVPEYLATLTGVRTIGEEVGIAWV